MTPAGWEKFLAWLDADPSRAGERYERLRQKLIVFFASKSRRIPTADYADKTFDRIAGKLEKGDDLSEKTPERYCLAVAGLLVKEFGRSPEVRSDDLESSDAQKKFVADSLKARAEHLVANHLEHRRECLQRCMPRLHAEEQRLVSAYYGGDGRTRARNRRHLAAELGISEGNLRLRAYHLRNKLKECLHNCLASATKTKS